MESFYFKKFKVEQHRSSMKVNTDGVLLPAWVNLFPILSSSKENTPFKVLDVGTGTGVIALITAQRLSCYFKDFQSVEGEKLYQIVGIDIDKASAQEAACNFASSPWSSSLQSKEISLQHFVKEFGDEYSESFSLILSNPPYFSSSLKSNSLRAAVARHNDSLPFDFILKASKKLLKRGGVLALILPLKEGEYFIKIAKFFSFSLGRICKLKSFADKKEMRLLLEFIKGESQELIEEELVIYEEGGENYTPQYSYLVQDFYLTRGDIAPAPAPGPPPAPLN